MKKADLQIDTNNINKDPEKETVLNITISQYNPAISGLEIEEDLTEKMIQYIEREVRGSYEYRNYTNYLKNELNLTQCALLPGLDANTEAVSLEFHHFPMNLYEITEAVAKKMIRSLGEDETLSCFDIADKVMEEHYRGNIGLVPLTKTLHEMAHNRSIIIPISKVNGNYKKFLSRYSDTISDDIKLRIKDVEMNSESDDSKAYNSAKLEKNITKFSIDYLENDDIDMGGENETN